MVLRVLIFFLGFATAFADEKFSNTDNIKALLTLLNKPLPSQQETAAPQQNVPQQDGNQQPSSGNLIEAPKFSNTDNIKALLTLLNKPLPSQQETAAPQQNVQQDDNQQPSSGNLIEAPKQVLPMSYNVLEAPSNDHASDKCSSNSYYSVTTLTPILSIMLEFLDHSSKSDKAYTVLKLIKTYLEGAPSSEEKIIFLDKIKLVEDHLLQHAQNADGERKYVDSSNDHKTTIVFQNELPGTEQQNCRETLGRLIQTSINIYKETAKHPQCQPTGFIEESLFYPNNVVKPQKPYQFVIIYPNPPSSYYTPDYSGVTILPNLGVKNPQLAHLYPKLTEENALSDGNNLQFLPDLGVRNPLLAHLYPKLAKENSLSDGNNLLFLPNLGVKNPQLAHLYPKLTEENAPNNGNNLQYLTPDGQNLNKPVLPLPQKENPHYDILALIRQYNLLHPESPKTEKSILEFLNNITGKPSSDYNPQLAHLYPKLTEENVPNNGNNLQYLTPDGQNLNKPVLPLPQKENPHYDILALIRQYNLLHPESPRTEKSILEFLNNITGKPSSDYNPTLPNNPYDVLQNYPNVPQYVPEEVPKAPSNNGYEPGLVYPKPGQPKNKPYHLYGEHNVPGHVPDKTQYNPELSLEILLSLLGQPEGGKTQPGLNHKLGTLWQYLHRNNPNPNKQILELKMPQNPSDVKNYIVDVPDGIPDQESLLDYLNQVQPDSHAGAYSGIIKPNYEARLKKLQQFLGVSNGNKLASLQNKANVIELTYVLKRPKPLMYRPIYYVKYRLPYETFLQNFQNLILKKSSLRSEAARVYKDFISVTNISAISPSLKNIDKEELLNLVFGNGTLVDARVVDISDRVLDEQLEATRKMNAELDPKVIEGLSSYLALNKSESKPTLDEKLDWLTQPKVTLSNVDDLPVQSLPTTSNLPAVNEGSSQYSNQVPGSSVSSAVLNYPLNVVPPIVNKNP